MRVLLFGPLGEVAGWSERRIAAPPPSLARLRDALAGENPALGAALADGRVHAAVDQVIVRGDATLPADAEIAFFHAVSGG